MVNLADDPDGPVCLAERRTSTGTWICIRPRHRSDSDSGPNVDDMRRRRGLRVRADRHYYIKQGTRVGQTGPWRHARHDTD